MNKVLNQYQIAFENYLYSENCARDLKAVVEKIKSYCGNGRLFFIGNGGSSCISAHLSEDFDKMAKIPSLCMANVGLITCLANDEGYENIFKIWLDSHFTRDDLLIAISSSGKSPNIIRAAKSIGSHSVITITGFENNNQLSKRGCINVHIPYHRYGLVESISEAFLHCVLDTLIEERKEREEEKNINYGPGDKNGEWLHDQLENLAHFETESRKNIKNDKRQII